MCNDGVPLLHKAEGNPSGEGELQLRTL